MTADTAASPAPFPAILRRAALWLAFLAPFFYLSYGYANALAAARNDVGSIVFGWEHSIPFIAWTIVPYWSINLFYGLSLLINTTTQGVDRLALRYLTAQLVAVSCFIAFPLAATFVRPGTSGLPGFMFAVLGGFDRPFNQAPSLHIALLVIIWDHIRHRLGGPLLGLWHLWCLLIGVSVLTTWQHHFIDIPTGALLGVFALWLFPRHGALPFAGARRAENPACRRLALRYGLGALALLAGAAGGALASPLWLFLLWPALALAIVAFGYATGNPGVFQKQADGTVSVAGRLLLAPYRLAARLNAWVWTRNLPPAVEIADGVFLGGYPDDQQADRFATVVDLAAELARPTAATAKWVSIPLLDLVPPAPAALRAAAEAVEQARPDGPVLVCCALGFQRSAGAVAVWLVATGRAGGPAEARRVLVGSGRPVHLHAHEPASAAQPEAR
ncbi:MAG: phosphatase PAP2/dual specificity phosphatase family protein [Rhizobiaceae bacterium]|nr:phosphatase PAP2/dual specificity phosphatase family protein [Rhizobiaceae bacterium]